jgi:hypothetical protein
VILANAAGLANAAAGVSHKRKASMEGLGRSARLSAGSPTSCNVVRTRSEEEASDTLMPLPKRLKTTCTLLYQISKLRSKLSLSFDVVDITRDLVARWSRPVPAPSVEALRLYLQQPLTEEEKIPISQSNFDRLCVPFSTESPGSALCAQQLSTLFRVSPDQRARSIKASFLAAIQSAPPQIGTEDCFHGTYDKNISDILKITLSGSTVIRNSNRNTSTALKRPDYGLIVNGHCIFRGEENGSESDGDPERELLEKIRYIYALLYVLGLL